MTTEEKKKLLTDTYLAEYDSFLNRARCILKCKQDAEDAVADAMVRACRHLHNYKDDNMKAWLYRIIINESIDHYKRNQRKTERIDFEFLPEFYRLNHDFYEEDYRDYVLSAFDKISGKHRQILELWALDVPYKDIAGLLNIKIGTVMSRIHNAKKNFLHKIKF